MDQSGKRTVVRLCILSLLLLSLWLFSKGKASTQEEKRLSVIINQPKESAEGGMPIVEIRCKEARLISANKLAAVECNVRNNTSKNITAVNLWYSIMLGGDLKDTHTLTIEALIHPDFRESYHPILPRTEQPLRMAAVSYDVATISGLEIGVDYVEFDDGSSLGPNVNGSRIIADMRLGAAKYKSWLLHSYTRLGGSAAVLVPLLKSGQSLPTVSEGLDLKNSDEVNGAVACRNRLRKIHDTKGIADVEKFLRK